MNNSNSLKVFNEIYKSFKVWRDSFAGNIGVVPTQREFREHKKSNFCKGFNFLCSYSIKATDC